MNRANKLTVDDMDRTARELAQILGLALRRLDTPGHPCDGNANDTPPAATPTGTLAERMAAMGIKPGQAITLEQHRELTAHMTRPLTQPPVMRHNKGDSHNDLGDMT